jgi:hypothetical protein
LHDTLVRIRTLHVVLPCGVFFGKGMTIAPHVWDCFSGIVLLADEEDGIADSLYIEAKRFVLSAHESKKVAYCASTRNNVHFRGREVWVEVQHRLNNGSDGVVRISCGVRITIKLSAVFVEASLLDRSPLWRLALRLSTARLGYFSSPSYLGL